jgi:hypothetical protein
MKVLQGDWNSFSQVTCKGYVKIFVTTTLMMVLFTTCTPRLDEGIMYIDRVWIVKFVISIVLWVLHGQNEIQIRLQYSYVNIASGGNFLLT